MVSALNLGLIPRVSRAGQQCRQCLEYVPVKLNKIGNAPKSETDDLLPVRPAGWKRLLDQQA